MKKSIILYGLVLLAGIYVAMKLIGCTVEVSGQIIDEKTGDPISNAKVYLKTTEGTLFDKNQYYWIYETDENGKYLYRSEDFHGSYEFVFATAEGYYPNLNLNGEKLILKRIPDSTLKIKEGNFIYRKKGGAKGFDFSKEKQVKPSKADILPAETNNNYNLNKKAEIIARGDGGFSEIRNLHDLQGSSAGAICTFYNANQAPSNGYKTRINWFDRGSIYFVKTPDGGYAKLKFTSASISADGNSIEFHFEYVFQPSNTRNLPPEYEEDYFKEWAILMDNINYINKREE